MLRRTPPLTERWPAARGTLGTVQGVVRQLSSQYIQGLLRKHAHSVGRKRLHTRNIISRVMTWQGRIVDRHQLWKRPTESLEPGAWLAVSDFADHHPKGVTSLKRRSRQEVSQPLLDIRANAGCCLPVVTPFFKVVSQSQVMLDVLGLCCAFHVSLPQTAAASGPLRPVMRPHS